MPIRFILYRITCIVNIILLSLLGVYPLCRTLFVQDMHFNGGIISIFILLLLFTLFLGNNFFGLALYKKLANHNDISIKEIKSLKIFFFIQLLIQLYALIYQLMNIGELMRNLKRIYLYAHAELFDHLVFEILPLVIILLTFYYEIFTFPLVNAIKKNYKAFQNDLDSIGANVI